MTNAYTEELVRTATEDNLLLDGMAIRPADATAKPLAVVWTHGFTGYFHEPFIVQIGRELAGHGYTVVTGHNRGHHFGARIDSNIGQSLLAGAWWEKIEQSPSDIAAWIDCAVGLGFSRVALLGHSLGGLKVAYYQAQRQDARIAGLVVASPPRSAGTVSPTAAQGHEPEGATWGRLSAEMIAQARALVAQGREQELLPWGSLGGSGTLSAQTCLSWAQTLPTIYQDGPEGPAIAQIRCPLFALYGTEEAEIGGAADLEAIRRTARSAARIETRLLTGADHLYNGQEAVVASALADWCDALSAV